MQKLKLQLFVLVVLVGVIISLAPKTVDTRQNANLLTVAVLDVGQGDAIYVEAPNGNQALFDAGNDAAILKVLKEVMHPSDTTINLVFATNPDRDHIGGFASVYDAYTIGATYEPGTISTTKTYDTFQDAIKNEGTPNYLARKGTHIVLDEAHGVFIDIIFPDRDVRSFSRNDGSIVVRLTYGATSFLLTGDSTMVTEHMMAQSSPEMLDVDVLKVGHHGSRTSTGDELLKLATPNYAAISYGQENSYGHPHPEVMSRLRKYNIEVYETAKEGMVVFESDGKGVWVKK